MSLLEPRTNSKQSCSWKSSSSEVKLLSSGFSIFSSLEWGCHIFSVLLPGMVQSPFEWGNQTDRGKTSGDLSKKSCEIRRMLLWERIAAGFFSLLMQMSSCGNAFNLGIWTQIIPLLQVWKKVNSALVNDLRLSLRLWIYLWLWPALSPSSLRVELTIANRLSLFICTNSLNLSFMMQWEVDYIEAFNKYLLNVCYLCE